jgi:hypothetical protein
MATGIDEMGKDFYMLLKQLFPFEYYFPKNHSLMQEMNHLKCNQSITNRKKMF